MSRHTAKTPRETKVLLANFQEKRKNVEDITGVEVDGQHMMGTLLNFIDGVTKQHTVKDMPKDVTKESFDKYIADIMSSSIR